MKHFKLLSAVIALYCMLITGCKKEVGSDNQLSLEKVQHETISAAKKSTQLSAQLKAKLAKLRSSLPAGYEKRLEPNALMPLNIHSEYRNMALRALKIIEPTSCDANTKLYQWLDKELAGWWDNDAYLWAWYLGMLDFPTYYALIFENSSSNQYFGVNGEYTHTMTKTFKDLQRFWNIQSKDIELVAMHGSMLLDRDKVYRMERLLFPWESEEEANYYVDLIVSKANTVPQYRKGNHPIFTFNAYAQPTFNFPPYGVIPDKIVMGDGILQAYTAIGYGDVAPQAILAHEYGHHVQFQLNLFGGVASPEATRRTELMADALSAYYLSHARGASMQWKRVRQFLQVFFNIGDCSFDSFNHHGTPTQRMAAAEWAYQLADNAHKQGHILTAQKFVALFDKQLPYIVKQ